MDGNNGKSVYVSYSRRSDYAFIKQLIAATKDSASFHALLVEEHEKNNSLRANPLDLQSVEANPDEWCVLYDENSLKPDGSISAFMEVLSEGDKIIVLLSPGYFQSPFCLTELLQIYRKRAHELLPVVVFVDGYQPKDVKLDTLQAHWRQQQPGNEQAKLLHDTFIDELPLILAWLLGLYDEVLESWDNLAHVWVDGDDTTIKNVIVALENSEQPRFAHISGIKRAELIETEIARIPRNAKLKDEFQKLRGWWVETDNGEIVYPLASGQMNFCEEGSALIYSLDALADWLKEMEKTMSPSVLRDTLAGEAKELLGLLLMSAVDERRLHILIHALNRQRDVAELSLMEENETTFQMIVSAVAFSAVHYIYEPEGGRRIKGAGMLTVTDQGAVWKNYYKSKKKEQDWLSLSCGLFQQMTPASGEHKTQDSLDGAMRRILKKRKDFFFLFEPHILNVDSDSLSTLRTKLGKEYPDIQHVVPEKGTKGSTYYRNGLDSGYLDQQIHEIYELIHRMTHEPKDKD